LIDHSPQITYACELEPQPLQNLFANPDVIPFLQHTRATVSIGILDLTPERAEVVRQLNEAGIPTTAWLLLPKDQGYWFNLDNFPQAAARYEAFQSWSRAHQLRWERIGLDIEPDYHAMQLARNNRLAGLNRLTRTAFQRQRLARGVRAYRQLIKQIHADGYAVETYQIPLIVDERKARSSFIQRLAGLVDLPEADQEVLMLYSSYMRPWGQGILWSYGSQAQGIGVGITGGGIDLEGMLDTRPLNWAELQTDLLLASQFTHNIFVFSLEGCVQQNFLPLLRAFDWTQPAQVPYSAARRTENYRSIFQRGLWMTARPAWLLFALALGISTAAYFTRRRR